MQTLPRLHLHTPIAYSVIQAAMVAKEAHLQAIATLASEIRFLQLATLFIRQGLVQTDLLRHLASHSL